MPQKGKRPLLRPKDKENIVEAQTANPLVGIGEEGLRKIVAENRPERVALRFSLLVSKHSNIMATFRERARDYDATAARNERQAAERGLPPERKQTGVKLVDNAMNVGIERLIGDLGMVKYILTEVFWQTHHSDGSRFFFWICFDSPGKSEMTDRTAPEGFLLGDFAEGTQAFVKRFLKSFRARYAHGYANPAFYAGEVRRYDIFDLVEGKPKPIKHFVRGVKPQHAPPALEAYLRYDAETGIHSVEPAEEQ
ncbi:MAG: hypothetical protein Q8P82_01585 [bacterium]|nr:hypothetical protein [bacterium]